MNFSLKWTHLKIKLKVTLIILHHEAPTFPPVTKRAQLVFFSFLCVLLFV